MRNSTEKPARLSISLSQADYANLQRVANENDISLAWVARKAIERFLESNPQADLFKGDEVMKVARR